ncbi:hypothetical protein SDC9_74392 [bioreactor metagenome]|uniref:Uncharacterized protein n=1 Tax=bioreactor metagenome TaxID=1076179 RepID=A0A644YHW7_9ZZZZ
MVDKMNEHRNEILILIKIIRYSIAIFFLSGGMVFLSQGEILPGTLSILTSIILTPAIADPIESKLSFSPPTYLRFIVILLLLMAISATLSR